MLIPWQQLEAETLDNLIVEFISRNGTDNGDERTTESNIAQVRAQLVNGSVVLVFCMESQSANLLAKANLSPEQRAELEEDD